MNIFMLHSLVPGVRFYRLTAPAKFLSADLKHNILLEDTSNEGLASSDWQGRAMEDGFHNLLEHMLKEVDVLVTQLVHTPGALAVLEGVREFYELPVILDLDDDVENVPYYNQGGACYKPDTEVSEIIRNLMRTVNAVTVSTPYLKERMGQYNKNTYVLPNSIDFDLWDKPADKLKTSKAIRIGWAGAQTHEDDFKMIVPAIKEILRKYKSLVHFYFVGGVPECVKALDDRRISYQNNWHDILKYPAFLKRENWDIGIAPLRDNMFNRAKSNLRWLEYSAMGIPTVAGNVEPMRRSIAHGRTGLLAYEPEEWVEHLSALIEDEELRKTMGKAANDKVRRDYNMKKNARLWAEVYRKVLDEEKVAI